jgi:hypothetical protein
MVISDCDAVQRLICLGGQQGTSELKARVPQKIGDLFLSDCWIL